MNNFKLYFKSVLIPLIIGGIVGIITSKYIDYNNLIKPPFSPPGILFPIIWTILYILMGISYGILKSKNLLNQSITQIYYTQLFVNAFWSIFFFVFKLRLFSFFWILLLAILVLVMIVRFYRQNKTSGLLQIPYLIWVIFASYLNISIYFLNR